jgi:hypothetical protein
MKDTYKPNKTSKNKKKNKGKNKKADDSYKNTKDSLDLGDGLTLFNPITEGLGFKDKVSDGVYTMQVEHDPEFDVETTSDGGVLNIGREEMGDGVLNIGEKGEVFIHSSNMAQPALFHSGHDGLIKRTAKKSGESFFGALIDVLFLVALSIFTAAAATEFSAYAFNFELMLSGDLVELGKLLLIFSAFFLSYRILTRVFYGRTLGEWSSRHQMGLIKQQHSMAYPLRVLFREMICLATGVFLFPILSSLFRRDVGYYFSGLQTYIEQKKR